MLQRYASVDTLTLMTLVRGGRRAAVCTGWVLAAGARSLSSPSPTRPTEEARRISFQRLCGLWQRLQQHEDGSGDRSGRPKVYLFSQM